MAGKIRAGAGDGAADSVNERGGHMGICPAQGNSSGISSDLQRKPMSGFDDQSERSWPELIGKFEKTVGHLADQAESLFYGIDQDWQGFRFGPALGAKYSFDRREIKGIDREAVKRIGRNSYDFAALDESGGIFHDVLFRCCG